jgi:hypothetical protein
MATKSSRVKLGSIHHQKANTKSFFLRLGEEGNTDPKYNYSVEVTVRDGTGAVVAKAVNPIVNLQSPEERAAFLLETKRIDSVAAQKIVDVAKKRNLKYEATLSLKSS